MEAKLNLMMKDLPIIFRQTSLELGFINPTIVEKDYWLVQILNILYQDKEFAKHHLFKGGTSLSKCYQLIKRFSEDLDITIDRSFLGFTQPLEDINELGNKRRKRYFDELLTATTEHLNKIKTTLTESLHKHHDNSRWNLYIDPQDPQRLLIEYPKVLEADLYPSKAYVAPKIVLELGCRGDMNPREEKEIKTYIEQVYPELSTHNSIPISTLKVERTFWEKITLLHKLSHQPTEKLLQNTVARHFYDIHELLKSEYAKLALQNTQLLKEVVQHTSVFFKSKIASYDTAIPGSLKIIPPKEILEKVEADYLAMEDMFFGEPVPFATIMDTLYTLEDQLNKVPA